MSIAASSYYAWVADFSVVIINIHFDHNKWIEGIVKGPDKIKFTNKWW